MVARASADIPYRLYLTCAVLSSALLVGISARDSMFGHTGDDIFLWVGLCGLIGLSTARLVQLRPKVRFSARAAPQFAAAILLSPAGAILATAIGVAGGYLWHLINGRNNRTDLVFNIAQSVLSTWIVSAVYRLSLQMYNGPVSDAVALLAAAITMFVVNNFLVAVAVTLWRGGPHILTIFYQLLWHDPLVYAALLVTGLLGVFLARENAYWAIPLLAVPIALTEHVVIRQAEESERERKIAVMEEVDAHRREFVAAVTHDLRTPLMTLKGFGELLADREDELMPEERAAVHGINASAEQLAEQIEMLLQLSELDAGMIKFVPRPTNVAALIGRVLDHMRFTANIKQVRLEQHMWQELPPVVLDPIRVEQVLNNVVSNAIKYAPPQSTVLVEAYTSEELLIMRVIDAGAGIAPEVLPFIFERFYRAPQQEDGRRHTGGLGLAIAKSIVELHGGTITAQSEPDQGSTFTITLPIGNAYAPGGTTVST